MSQFGNKGEVATLDPSGRVVQMKSIEQVQTGLVTFREGANGFAVYVPSGCTPRMVAEVMARVLNPSAAYMHPGQVAAQFIRETDKQVMVRLVNPDFYRQVEMTYEVFWEPDEWNMRVSQTRSGHVLYNGRLCDFREQVDTLSSGGLLTGKLLKFYYEGGTEPGYRVVKVESIHRNGGGLLIKGKDVMKDQYRSFNTEKVRGDIVLVN